jgi:hypothetical protein
MQTSSMGPAELEDEANRVRARMAGAFSELRTNLQPGNLATELARGAGLRDVTPAGALNFATRRHPVPTALAATALALWAFSLYRSRSVSPSGGSESRSLADAARSLAHSATDVFRQRAEEQRKAFLAEATSKVTAGASRLVNAVESNIGSALDGVPISPSARPLVSSAIELILLASFAALLPRSK